MSFAISIVTLNRAEVLARTLQAIQDTCQVERPLVYVTDNASMDETPVLLCRAKRDGLITDYVTLAENLGTSGGRNAHWANCIGHDAIRMDDKVLPLAAGWLTAMKRQADQHHAIIATPYDESVMMLHRIAPAVEYVKWDRDEGRGGPLIFVPAEVTTALGGVDELMDGDERALYGWDDCLQIERAILLGWNFGFTLRVPVEYLAKANPARREGAMRWHSVYLERRRQYAEAERDVLVDVKETVGYKAGMEAIR